MLLGNIDKFKGTGLVAFLDILGFSKEIEDKWSDKNENPLYKILELKKNIPVYSEKDFGDSISNSVRKYICRVQTISDSILISFGFNDPVIYGDIILGILSFFDTISFIWRNTLESGFTIRGAADFGEIYWDDKEIIGPAFIKVYKLEQFYAKTSRVIISSKFNQNLAKIFYDQTTFWNNKILKILRIDNDGFLILNPHNLYSDQDGSNDKERLIGIIENMRNKTSGFNKEKYSPLLAALNSKKYNLLETNLGKY